MLKDTPHRLHALFAKQLHVDVPSVDTDLLETGVLDSLQFVSLLAMVEREFHVAIPLADLDLDRVKTITALAEVVDELTYAHDDARADQPLRIG